jgi:hypothetical protein
MTRKGLQTLTARALSDKDGRFKIDCYVGDAFVEFDAVVVLLPRKKYASEEAYQSEWREAIESLAGSCPGLFNPRDPDRRCPNCNGVGYLLPPLSAETSDGEDELNG